MNLKKILRKSGGSKPFPDLVLESELNSNQLREVVERTKGVEFEFTGIDEAPYHKVKIAEEGVL